MIIQFSTTIYVQGWWCQWVGNGSRWLVHIRKQERAKLTYNTWHQYNVVQLPLIVPHRCLACCYGSSDETWLHPSE